MEVEDGRNTSLPPARDIAKAWLAPYAQAVTGGDVEAIAHAILPNGWFRDVLTLNWDYRALEGTDKIINYLQSNLKPGQVREFKLVGDLHCEPVYVAETGTVEAVFTYETMVAHGRGYVRLVQDGAQGTWRALNVCMMVMDLKGNVEVQYESGLYGGHTLAWSDVYRDRRSKVEGNPHVLIIGSGQTGLQIAARFKQMNIPAVVIERNDRVGDNWRTRYPTLTLHTVRMLYQPYPRNWPVFTPRDKISDWLEMYSHSQDLVVWTKSHIADQPVYDDQLKRWSVTINRDGKPITIRPSHIVMATGTLGHPHFVRLPHQEKFLGVVLHASQYQGGVEYASKRVVVVGAGNTGIDICQDLVFHKAKSVTMVQRSSTCVTSGDKTVENLGKFWPDDVPVEIGDFKFGSIPLGQLKKMMQSQTDEMWKSEEELHKKLRKGGIELNMGPEGEGQLLMVWERGGGYWIDKGGADLIASGHIRVKQGVQPSRFTEGALVFTDGTELEADVVIFATGYANIRESSRKVFGDATIDRTCQVYGLDEEGELRGSYRPTGHPGLWFGTGDFWNSRFMSKQLAIQIKAIELGLVDQDGGICIPVKPKSHL
ncbi:dimethylaniline monooxygenase (N-oxide-forming) [Cristinia sonorae]|uniref:Dimethylaniline monooxygenase (N-oxide-forming) n=1 Tax=Cristinia sonorae TaxID=1940300 RepID=A0A8K0UNX7_9AGAR|nr:dimethylaniline monooxygenase (N-oxide-forming) [Cristinia sonorae]